MAPPQAPFWGRAWTRRQQSLRGRETPQHPPEHTQGVSPPPETPRTCQGCWVWGQQCHPKLLVPAPVVALKLRAAGLGCPERCPHTFLASPGPGTAPPYPGRPPGRSCPSSPPGTAPAATPPALPTPRGRSRWPRPRTSPASAATGQELSTPAKTHSPCCCCPREPSAAAALGSRGRSKAAPCHDPAPALLCRSPGGLWGLRSHIQEAQRGP